MITPEDKQFIDEHRHHYETLIRADYLGNLDGSVLNRMLSIIKQYFAPAYLANLWCQPCVADLVKYLYTQVDAMPKEVPPIADVVIRPATFPKHDEPTIIEVPADTIITEPKKRGRKPNKK